MQAPNITSGSVTLRHTLKNTAVLICNFGTVLGHYCAECVS